MKKFNLTRTTAWGGWGIKVCFVEVSMSKMVGWRAFSAGGPGDA